MDQCSATAEKLNAAAATLYVALASHERKTATHCSSLEKVLHDARAHVRRRAAFNLIDRKKYALGGAFELAGNLELDPIFLAGFLSHGALGVLLLTSVLSKSPSLTFVEALAVLSDSEAGESLRDEGVWQSWNRLAEIYRKETEEFQRSREGRDPSQKWRSKKPSCNQTYIIAQICDLLQLEVRQFATRGEAFDWIRDRQGNPRFNKAPLRPDLSGLLAGRP